MAGEIGNNQNRFIFVFSDETEYFPVFGMEKLDAAAAQRLILFSDSNQALHPPEQ